LLTQTNFKKNLNIVSCAEEQIVKIKKPKSLNFGLFSDCWFFIFNESKNLLLPAVKFMDENTTLNEERFEVNRERPKSG